MELHYPIYWGVSQSISWEIPIHQWTGRMEDIMRSKSRSDSYCKHLLDSNDSWAMLSERELHKLSDCSDLRQGKVTSADRVGFLGHSQILAIMGLVQNYQSPRIDGFSRHQAGPAKGRLEVYGVRCAWYAGSGWLGYKHLPEPWARKRLSLIQDVQAWKVLLKNFIYNIL